MKRSLMSLGQTLAEIRRFNGSFNILWVRL